MSPGISIETPVPVHVIASLVVSVVSVSLNPSVLVATAAARLPTTVTLELGVMVISPVEEMELIARESPVNVVSPADPIVPVVMILLAPVSILPKPLVILPLSTAPIEVRDEESTPLPSPVPLISPVVVM